MKLIVATQHDDRVVDAALVDIGDGEEQFAAHRSVDTSLGKRAWSVTHVDTGLRLASGDTAKAALELAESEWKAKTPVQRAAVLERARSIRVGRQNATLEGILS